MRLYRYVTDFPRELKTLPKSIHRISLVMFIYMLIWGILDPFLTLYFYEIFGYYTYVALITALMYAFSILFSLPFGDLADIVSKKKLIGFFLILYLPFGFILASLGTFTQFVIFSFYHAFLATGMWSAAESYTRSHSPPHKTAESMGYFDAAISLSLIIGSVIGGFLITVLNIKILFYTFPVFVLAALFILPGMPDHHGISNIGLGVKRLRGLGLFRFEFRDYFQTPGLPLVSLLSFFGRVTSFSALVILPLLSDKLGANHIQVGLIFAAFAVPTLFEAPFSVLGTRFSHKTVILVGGLLSILFLSAAYFVSNLISLFVLSLLLALMLALINPVIEGLVTKLMPRHKIGELNGVHRSIVLLAAAAGSFMVGPVADKFSIQTAFLTNAVLMTIFFFVVLLSKMPENVKT